MPDGTKKHSIEDQLRARAQRLAAGGQLDTDSPLLAPPKPPEDNEDDKGNKERKHRLIFIVPVAVLALLFLYLASGGELPNFQAFADTSSPDYSIVIIVPYGLDQEQVDATVAAANDATNVAQAATPDPNVIIVPYGLSQAQVDATVAAEVQERSQTPTPTELPHFDVLTLLESGPNDPISWQWINRTPRPLNLQGLFNTSGHPMTGFIPDGATVSYQQGDVTVVEIPGVRQQFRFTRLPDGSFSPGTEVFRPDRQSTEFGTWEYANVNTQFVINGQRYGLSHMESWSWPDNGANFTAQIGLVRLNPTTGQWELVDTVINGIAPIPAGTHVSGAGQPTAFVRDGFVYTLFVDWTGQSTDAIYTARVPVDQVENPNAWRRWNGQGFDDSALHPTTAVPVITPRHNEVYAALPNAIVSSTGQVAVIYETNVGFDITLFDPTTMRATAGQTVLAFPNPEIKYNAGSEWYSYPSLIDPQATEPQTFTPGHPLTLVFSEGHRGDSGHTTQALELIIDPKG